MTDLSIQLAPLNSRGLLLANPVMTASGTFGYGDEYSHLIDIQRLGAIVCKGTTLKPRDGNPQPRIIEVKGGILNSVGLENIGVEALIREKAPQWARWQVPVIVNIAGESIEEYGRIAVRLDAVAGISGIEVNISCPNVKSGGVEFGTDPEVAAKVTRAVKEATSLPVIVKLSPNVTDIVSIARSVCDAGADALTLVNTLRGMAIDVLNRVPALGTISGGLSGPVLKPVALAMVYKVASAVKVPIIGCGGIMGWEDALEFIMAGASAIQVGTATFANSRAALLVLDGIGDYLKRNKIRGLQGIIGSARV